jgi:hypothetical protein
MSASVPSGAGTHPGSPRNRRFAIGRLIFAWIVSLARTAQPHVMFPSYATYGAPRIQLKGHTRVEATVTTASKGSVTILSGAVTDDASNAAPSRVALRVVRGTDAGANDADVAIGSASPESCGPSTDSAGRMAIETPSRLVLWTDASARFCVRLVLVPDRYVAILDVSGAPLLDDATIAVPLDLLRKNLTLTFDPEPSAFSIDDNAVAVVVTASTEEEGRAKPAADLTIELSAETGLGIGGATTDASGHARFSVPSSRIGPPGPGELRASFSGDADTGPASRVTSVERRTVVRLVVPDARAGVLPAGGPEDGIDLRVRAIADCSSRGCRTLPSGIVTARVDDAVVGAAALVNGEARIAVHVAAPDVRPLAIALRYVPGAPWFRTSGDLLVVQPVGGPSRWGRIGTVLAGFAALGWFVAMRIRIPQRRDPMRPAGDPGPVVAGIRHVEADPSTRGWSGRIVDAHDSSRISGATVRVERASFTTSEVIAQVLSDSLGEFSLPLEQALPSDRLVIESCHHVEFEHPLPRPGVLEIALVLRRRALLDRLVDWARRRGSPFDARPEPTPAQVRVAASSEPSVARWADAVERAAFGGVQVDSAAQAEVDRLDPEAPPEATARSERAR